MRLPVPDLEWIATCTKDLWDELRGRRIFVTGGTGFFGCWILESFRFMNQRLNLGAQMTVLTRSPADFANKCPHLAFDPAVALHQGDVRDFEFPSGQFEYVIHAATEARLKQATEAPLEMLSTIVEGTERTLQFAVSHGTKKFLLTSSGAVYGRQPSEMTHVPESFTGGPNPLDPASVYAEGKRTSELLCALYQKIASIECKIARCWAFCGPHLPLEEHFAIGNFIGDALAGRPILINGDGSARRSYLYAADLAIWLWTILFRAPALTALNVGSAQDLSISDLAQTVARVIAPESEIHIAENLTATAVVSRYVPSVVLARDLLGLVPTISLEDAIRRTADWYLLT